MYRARQQGSQMSQVVSHDMLSASSSSADIVRQQQQEEGTSWQYDPNEPRYCLCNDVSYGDMVGCDNNDVSIVIKRLYCKTNTYSQDVRKSHLKDLHHSSCIRSDKLTPVNLI